MPLKPPQPIPQTQRDWDQWARTVAVTPDKGSVTTDRLVDHAITNSKLRTSASASIIGRPDASPGDPTDITSSADNTFLARRSGTLAWDGVKDTDVPVTIARQTDVAAAITAHVGLPDPHTQYLQQSEGDALYQPLAAVLSLLHAGTGSPETVVTAPVGHLYLRQDGGAATTLYVKESGAAATGWIGK